MRLPLILATAVALALPAGASAKTKYYIPPGNSSGSEYVESVPTAGGNSPTSKLVGAPGGGSVSGGGGGGAISHQTQSSLKKYGPVGAQTAAFANATAPAAQGSAGSGGSADSGSGSGSGSGSTARAGATGGAGGAPAAHGGVSAAGGTNSTGGSAPALSVARSVTGLGGHGGFGLLPLVLIVAALGIGAIALRRRLAS